KVGKFHSNARSHVRNHGNSRAARAQNPSGSRFPSSSHRWTTGVSRLATWRMIASGRTPNSQPAYAGANSQAVGSWSGGRRWELVVDTTHFVTLMNEFRAFRIVNDDGRIHGTVVETSLPELSPGDVVIRAEYSSVNYKDALAATGSGKILKRFPLIGGIDVAGHVESSSDARFRVGDACLVHSYEL